MVTVVTYDIPENRLRTRIENHCRDAGLTRVQRSVFRGRPDRKTLEALVERLDQQIRNQARCVIQIYLIDEEDFRRHLRLTSQGPIDDNEPTPQEVVVL